MTSEHHEQNQDAYNSYEIATFHLYSFPAAVNNVAPSIKNPWLLLASLRHDVTLCQAIKQ